MSPSNYIILPASERSAYVKAYKGGQELPTLLSANLQRKVCKTRTGEDLPYDELKLTEAAPDYIRRWFEEATYGT